ncbi:MAG TPA: tripartite tricarboxylate transporter substrate binding protein [Burkholderiales bacterium]|nr:tripartite tricarboxylate transporter substrate binding protein [Burkholderiales bacterium]
MLAARIVLAALCPLLAAGAQTYPTRPVRMVVAFAPGGGTDIVGRIIGRKLTDTWPHPVVIDNRAGAASIIGTEIVAKAVPDGYTIQTVSMSHALNAALFKKLPYDTIRDFAHVILAARAPNVLVAHPSLPVKTVKELIAQARAQPGKIAFSSSGTGGVSHLSAEVFRSAAAIDLLHVPYKGAGPAMTALLAGEVQLMMATTPVAITQMKAGRVRAIAISSRKRSALAPDIPTIAESGFPGFESDTWYGVLAPARTAPAIVAKINSDINQLLKTSDVQAQFGQQGAEPAGGSPEEFRAFAESEVKRWTKVIRAAGIEAN